MKTNVGHTVVLLLLSVFSVALCHAETRELREAYASELRIGWGDQAFESLCWHEPTISASAVLPNYSEKKRTDFCYYQHWWMEYQYRYNSWFGFGLMVDGSGVSWKEDISKQYFYNITFMPTIRFTYLLHEYVSLYSGMGLGANVNSGTEVDLKGRTTAGGVAFNITLLGCQVGRGRWFGAAEIGGMYALQNANAVFLASSRIFALSVGVHF